MDLRLALNLRELGAKRGFLEAQGLGAEVYLDPAHLLEEAFFAEKPGLPGLSVHLPFWNLSLLSPDPEVADLSLRRLLLGLERAAGLGADRAVFHSGIPPLLPPEEVPAWTERLAEALGPVVQRAKALGIGLFLENTFEEEPLVLKALLQRVPGLGFCFDAAHARVFSRTPEARPWLALGPGHLHLNDTHPPYDRHGQLGTGVLAHENWLGAYLDRPWVLEVRGDPGPSLRWLAAFLEGQPRPRG